MCVKREKMPISTWGEEVPAKFLDNQEKEKWRWDSLSLSLPLSLSPLWLISIHKIEREGGESQTKTNFLSKKVANCAALLIYVSNILEQTHLCACVCARVSDTDY